MGSIIAYASRDATGALTSGEVVFDVNYNFGQETTFTGLHIHAGGRTVSGPVTIGTNLSTANPVQAPAPAIGNIRRRVEVDLSNAAARDTLNGLFTHPGDYYLNIHSSRLPGGAVRGQLRTTDTIPLSTMLQMNPPSATGATAPATITLHTLRGPDASVQAAVAEFDVATRFPGATNIMGLTINGFVPPNQIGPPVVSSGLTPATMVSFPTASGHISRFVTISMHASLEALDNLLVSPDIYFAVLTSSTGPAGGISAPLFFPPSMAPPEINAVISAVSDPNLTTLAKGGLATAWGSGFAKVNGDLRSFAGSRLPTTLNGAGVTIGGVPSPMVAVTGGQLVFQVPFEVPTGRQPLLIYNGSGISKAFMVTIAPVAPGLYFNSDGGIATHLDYSLVSSQKPAAANEAIWLYATGLGPTIAGPSLVTGVIPNYEEGVTTANVTATVGGRAVEVVSSIPAPGYIGLYQILIRMPAGLASGNQPVSITIGGIVSNSINLAIQ